MTPLSSGIVRSSYQEETQKSVRRGRYNTQNPLSITISTSSFTSGSAIGSVFYLNAGCKVGGVNTSPQLSWTISGDTSQVSSLRCRCIDIDAGGFIHWTVTTIPVASGSIAQNGTWPVGSTIGTTSYGPGPQRANGWAGPCPPSLHTYQITIWAVNSGGTTLATSNIISFTAAP